MDGLIEIDGESVTIRRRSLNGVDDYNRPKYAWNDQATEKAVIQRLRGDERLIQIGEFTVEDCRGFFKSDSVIQGDDRVKRDDDRVYDVKSLEALNLRGTIHHVEALLKYLPDV